MESAALSTAKTCCGKVKPVEEPVIAAVPEVEAPQHEAVFSVEGIHCASCIRAIESALAREPNIVSARVNMSTKRLQVGWKGNVTREADFAAIVEKLGYRVKPFEASPSETKSKPESFLLRCMAVSGFAMGNIMLLSVVLWSTDQHVMGMATRDFFHWLSALIAIPAIAYAGRPFFRSAWGVLKQGHTNMDVPISLALLLASGMSLVETWNHGEHAYFDSAVMLLFFLLIGRWLDARVRGKARQTAEQLLGMLVGNATVLENGVARSIPIKELREDMQVQVASGEKIPADAVVVSGESEVDTSLVTGETLPRTVQAGEAVHSGTINGAAPLTLRVTKPSENSLLAEIVRLMEQAEQGRARYVRLADRAAKLYTPVVHTLGALTFLGWLLLVGAPWQTALLHGVTVLIITCPCALGLAVPVVQVLASNWLMRRGVLVKSGDALERLAAVDTVVFDKTGTLTLGKPVMEPGIREGGNTGIPDSSVQLAASLAVHSKHPLAQAMTSAWDGALLSVKHAEEVPGMGVKAEWQGKEVRLGRSSWVLGNQNMECGNTGIREAIHQELWLGDAEPQRFTFTDAVRDDAVDVVKALQAKGLDVQLLSGDRIEVAQAMASALGITQVEAELLPSDKCRILETLRKQGRTALMVGDGLNDAPALAAAHVSMSPSSGMDITQNTADMVFQGEHLQPVLDAWWMAQFSTKLLRQNFMLAIGYNIIAVPLAIMGYVTPVLAALAMSSSSLLVIGNSFRINLQRRESR